MSRTDLIEAVRAGEPDSLRDRIAAGADVNQQDEHGWTPLAWAAAKGDLAAARALVEGGADVSRVGRDLRTPRMIAVAAGRVEVARYLSAVEADRNLPAGEPRPYCRAYYLRDLRAFAAWVEPPDAPEIAYLHQDHRVTRGIWPGEDVLFDRVTPEWREFCRTTLAFRVPDDVELIGRPAESE